MWTHLQVSIKVKKITPSLAEFFHLYSLTTWCEFTKTVKFITNYLYYSDHDKQPKPFFEEALLVLSPENELLTDSLSLTFLQFLVEAIIWEASSWRQSLAIKIMPSHFGIKLKSCLVSLCTVHLWCSRKHSGQGGENKTFLYHWPMDVHRATEARKLLSSQIWILFPHTDSQDQILGNSHPTLLGIENSEIWSLSFKLQCS